MRLLLIPFCLSACFPALAAAEDLPAGGAFSAYDVTAGKAARLDGGDDGLSVHATTKALAGRTDVSGYIENAKGGDRAVILEFRTAAMGPDAVFSNSLDPKDDRKVGATGELEGNAFPVAALEAGGKAVAIAIPPDDPCEFGVAGSARGLAVKFYVGISAATRKFPNRAPFHFIVYAGEPGWGFRGALAKYYGFFPERYVPRMKSSGLWLFQVKGLVPADIDHYAFNVLELQSKDVKQDLERDRQHHVRDLAYTLPGQRELKFLPELPKDYDAAMKDFAAWKVEDANAHIPTKENGAAGNDQWLKEEVASSACKGPDGKYIIEIRDTPWGRKSVSFKVNPSPALFADQPTRTVGKDTMKLIDGWLKAYPAIGGVLMDSLGANWPAALDCRADHFPYAEYPLTFGPDGKLAIYNEIGHYEFAKALHDKLVPAGGALFANGIYAYLTGKTPEHYRGKDFRHRVKIGRFFDAALLDGGTSEVGARANIERCQDARTLLGRKYYSLINYDWKDGDKVEDFFNRALCYDIFPSNTKVYPPGEQYEEGGNEGVSYVDNPNGYGRDKDLIKWVVPLARMLYDAGWEPVTQARLEGGDHVWMERYGSGNSVYFTVFNDSAKQQTVTVTVPLEALGFSEGNPDFKELAHDGKLEQTDQNQFKLTLEPHRTYIINMTKPWLVGFAGQTGTPRRG